MKMTHTPSRTLFALISALASLQSSAARAADDETTLPANVVANRDVTYVTRATGPMKLDVFTPPGDGPFPVVLWIHGGAWKMGDKAAWPHMNFLLRAGFAVVNVEYRFSQAAPFPAQLDDVTAALDYVAMHAAEYRLDASRVAATGESAGGHLASLLGMQRTAAATKSESSGKIRAVIDLFGPADLVHVSPDPNLREPIDQLLGGVLADRLDLAKSASPLTHVSKDEPPFLIFHGTKDPLVPFEQSQQLVGAMKAAGASVEFFPVPDAGHAGPAFWTPTQQDKMIAFLKLNLASH